MWKRRLQKMKARLLLIKLTKRLPAKKNKKTRVGKLIEITKKTKTSAMSMKLMTREDELGRRGVYFCLHCPNILYFIG
jgi:predicted nucleotidyltransferase